MHKSFTVFSSKHTHTDVVVFLFLFCFCFVNFVLFTIVFSWSYKVVTKTCLKVAVLFHPSSGYYHSPLTVCCDTVSGGRFTQVYFISRLIRIMNDLRSL